MSSKRYRKNSRSTSQNRRLLLLLSIAALRGMLGKKEGALVRLQSPTLFFRFVEPQLC